MEAIAFLGGMALAVVLMRYEFKHTNSAQDYYDLAVRLGEIYDRYFDVMEHEDLVALDTAKVRLAWGVPKEKP